jgi:type I restriction enzyme M protein
MNHSQIESFLWGAQDLLRDYFEPHEVGNYILPFVVLKRIDDILVDSKEIVLERLSELEKQGITEVDKDLRKVSGGKYFYNISEFKNLKSITKDPDTCNINLKKYIDGFSINIKEIFKNFKMDDKIDELSNPEIDNLLFPILEHFTNKNADLSPDKVDHMMMGLIYENLIRKTNDLTKKKAGQYFTPRDVIDLMIHVLLSPHKELLKDSSLVRSIYDPAVGTGGMLYMASNYIKDELKSKITLNSYGQDNLPFSYAICKSEMILRGLNPDNIKFGNSLTKKDQFSDYKFRYIVSNPPYGTNWKGFATDIKEEADLGEKGRYFVDLPGQGDGQLLFLQHMISKMYDDELGSRIGIIYNGSPLFTGSADSGESNIRKWVIENDLLECIIALPKNLFYNTGLFTYIWILNNRKPEKRKKKIQLIDGRLFFEKMSSKLGEKSYRISKQHVDDLTKKYSNFKKDEHSKIFDNDDFGYTKIIIKKPFKKLFNINLKNITAFENSNIIKKLNSKQNPKSIPEKKIFNIIKKISKKSCNNPSEFDDLFFKPLDEVGLKLTPTTKKSISDIFSENNETLEPIYKKLTDSHPIPDPDFKFYEKIPLKTKDIKKYFETNIKPFLDDGVWYADESHVGYEIPFTKIFHKYKKLPLIREINADIETLQKEISTDLEGLMK